MKFIRTKNGYVRAMTIDYLQVVEKEDGFDLMAYAVVSGD